MNDAQLKPCPFCGGKPEWKSGGPGCAWVSCTNCAAETSDGSIPRIAAAWNRRADLPATPAQIAASPEVRALVDVIQRVIADPHWRTTDNTLWPDMCKAVAAFKAMEAGE